MNLLYNITFSPASTFCALNFFERRSLPNTLLIEKRIQFQVSIFFQRLLAAMEVDLRHAHIWLSWFDIFLDARNHGYDAVASMNAIETMICKKCSNIKKRIFLP